MWQLATLATNASSGSTAAALDQGAGTMCGLADAATLVSPSKFQLCARLYCPLAKSSPGEANQRMVAVCVGIDFPLRHAELVSASISPAASQFTRMDPET